MTPSQSIALGWVEFRFSGKGYVYSWPNWSCISTGVTLETYNELGRVDHFLAHLFKGTCQKEMGVA